MAAKTHTILIAGGSGLVGHAAIKFAIAAGHFVIALVRRGGSLSVGGLASEEALKIIEADFDALDQYQPEISAETLVAAAARRDPARRHQLRCGQATLHRQGRTQTRKPRSRPLSLPARRERQDNLGR